MSVPPSALIVATLVLTLHVFACSPTAPPSPASTGSGLPAPAPSPTLSWQAPVALTIGPAFQGSTLRGTLVDASESLADIVADCPGLTHPSGVQRFELQQSQQVRVDVAPSGIGMMDLSLAIVADNGAGASLCADDAADSLNPVWQGVLLAGSYRFIVAADVATPVPYQITVSPVAEAPVVSGLAAPVAITDGTPVELNEQGQFGGASMGSTTAAFVLEGRTGGPRAAADLGPECRGFIAEAPDHVLTVTDAVEVVMWTDAPGDPTLVLQGPDLEFHCNDDTWGLQPLLRTRLEPGNWAVFVGEYEATEQHAYRLTVSRGPAAAP
jgi:hypothetical protein